MIASPVSAEVDTQQIRNFWDSHYRYECRGELQTSVTREGKTEETTADVVRILSLDKRSGDLLFLGDRFPDCTFTPREGETEAGLACLSEREGSRHELTFYPEYSVVFSGALRTIGKVATANNLAADCRLLN